ncbi:MAG TPA: hypothetical protein VML19_03450 [Verrucomicrobiae bacterium]|nr:hypothetical protein [Verrucomicrobiae bacterium]
MRLIRLAVATTWTGLITTALTAAGGPAAKMPRVNASVQIDGEFNGDFLALKTATRLYRQIGVALTWVGPRCPSDAIRIRISRNTPSEVYPGALAYATPFEGTRVRIFLDRIEDRGAALAPHLLGYVLAHEIGHILQGTNRHSERGIMKAHWDQDDFYWIRLEQLRFAEDDKVLIRTGIQKRTTALTAPQSELCSRRDPGTPSR